MTSTGKFSLQWVNTSDKKRPMCSVRFSLRDALSEHGEGGLTCRQLFLDQVHIHFRPSDAIATEEYMPGDKKDLEWVTETLQLYVRLSPGARHTLYTSGVPLIEVDPSTVPHPQRSLVYSTALSAAHATSADGDDSFCRTYRPVRDLPVLEYASRLSDLQVDLLWPLLQGNPTGTAWWSVPDYRINRVICEFSFTS